MGLSSRLYDLFFVRNTASEKSLPVWAKYVIPILLFAVIRVVTDQALEYRHAHYDDDLGYIAEANYVAAHGHLAPDDDQLYRQFAGLSLLMDAVNVMVGNMMLSGYLIVFASAVAAICLVQYLFDDFRMTVIFTFFFPWWISETVAIYGEAPTDVCFLLGLWTLRDAKPWSVLYVLGLLVCGYGLVIRPPSLFLLLPFVACFIWARDKSLVQAAGGVIIACLPFVTLLAWTWMTIGVLCPQYRIAHEFLLISVDSTKDPSHFSRNSFDWPLQSLIEGITDPYERDGKKAMVLVALGICFATVGCLALAIRKQATREARILPTALLLAFSCYFFFHLCLGGTFGYRFLERYMGQTTAIMCYAFFYRRPLRWTWIIVLALLFTVYSFYTGSSTRPLGIFK